MLCCYDTFVTHAHTILMLMCILMFILILLLFLDDHRIDFHPLLLYSSWIEVRVDVGRAVASKNENTSAGANYDSNN